MFRDHPHLRLRCGPEDVRHGDCADMRRLERLLLRRGVHHRVEVQQRDLQIMV
jgi:hypothetical protein